MRFVLAKHALPIVDPSAPASTWLLGDEGRAGAAGLGSSVGAFGIVRVVSSTEPKASETASIAASVLGLAVDGSYDGFREHRRESVGFMGDEDFDAAARALFATPDEPVWGEETGAEARQRFAAALDDVVSEGTLVVAHGTVISLWCAANCGVDGYDLWKQLHTPSFVVINGSRVETVIARVVR